MKEVHRDHFSSRNNCDNDNAILALYDLYWESLFKYIIRIIKDEQDTADIIQDSFIVLWEMKDELPKLKSLKSYLFIIARNKAFKFLKSSLRQQEFRDAFVSEYASIAEQFQQDIDRQYLSGVIDKEVSKLPEKMRIIFLLSRKEYLTYKEIADKLKISELTVKKQISNAIKQLKQKIDYSYVPTVYLLKSIADTLPENNLFN